MSKPSARRCAACQTNWPDDDKYSECPRGHGETFKAWDEQPMAHNEATRIAKAYRDFEAFYDRLEEQRVREEADRIIREALEEAQAA
jgi:predicted  nucleic acid-binding Zn-ribbon protein